MANLAIIGSHSVNGVAGKNQNFNFSEFLTFFFPAIHSEILKRVVFKDFYELFPEKFNNKTNGVTPRRWVHLANRPLSDLLTERLGCDEWMTNLMCLEKLREFVDDGAFQMKFMAVKRKAKV